MRSLAVVLKTTKNILACVSIGLGFLVFLLSLLFGSLAGEAAFTMIGLSVMGIALIGVVIGLALVGVGGILGSELFKDKEPESAQDILQELFEEIDRTGEAKGRPSRG